MSIVITSRSRADSMLHLEVPVQKPDMEFEVEILLRPKENPFSLPPGYFDLIGSVDDTTLTIHPQPQLKPPVEVE